MSAPALCALAGILFHVCGYALYVPVGPDSPHGALLVFGAFLIFLSALFSFLSWGHLLARTRPLWEKFLWGASLTLLLLGTLGFAPILQFTVLWRGFLLCGCGIALVLERRGRAPARARFAQADLFSGVACGLALLGASQPQSFWDSLWYHLPAARLWYDAGRIHLPARLPIAFQTGLWDYQFLLGQILLGAPNGGGLLPAQLFSQWMSLASAFFAFLLLRTEEDLRFTPFAAFVGLAGTEIFFEAEFAKNDWAVVLWSLAALVLLRQRRFQAAAFVAGLALATKLTAAFFLVPWGVLYFYSSRKEPLRLVTGAVLVLAGAFPIWARNFYFTANPFFPALASLFPSPLMGPSWAGLASYSDTASGSWTGKLLALPRASAGVLGLLAARWLEPRHRALALIAGGALALLFFGLGPRAEWRFAGAGLVLAAACGAAAFERLAGKLGVRAALLASLWWFPLDWKAPLHLGVDTAVRAREGVSGAAMAWIRMNAEPGEVATLNETRIYYLFPRFPWRAFDDPKLDTALASVKDPAAMTAVFRSAGVRYLVLSAEFIDRAYDRRICDWAYELSEKNPQAVPFRVSLSRVLDLSKLP